MNIRQLNCHRSMPVNVDVVIVHTGEGLGGKTPKKEPPSFSDSSTQRRISGYKTVFIIYYSLC